LEVTGLCPYQRIIDDAKRDCLCKANEEAAWFLRQVSTIDEAIAMAANSLFPSEKTGALVIHSHQRLNGKAALCDAASALRQLRSEIVKARNFADLYNVVSAIKMLPRLGALAVYDISERIGWFLKIFPDEVYLHAGVREGAAAIGLSVRSQTLPKARFPKSFQQLSPSAIETILCVYKRDLANPSSFGLGKSSGNGAKHC
jgi:hypothetical protein